MLYVKFHWNFKRLSNQIRNCYRNITVKFESKDQLDYYLSILKDLNNVHYIKVYTKEPKNVDELFTIYRFIREAHEWWDGFNVYLKGGRKIYIAKRGEVVKDYYPDGVYYCKRKFMIPFIENYATIKRVNDFQTEVTLDEKAGMSYIPLPEKSEKASYQETQWFEKEMEKNGFIWDDSKMDYVWKKIV